MATGTLTAAGVEAGMADTSVTWAQSHPRGVALALVPTAHCPLALAYPLSPVVSKTCLTLFQIVLFSAKRVTLGFCYLQSKICIT